MMDHTRSRKAIINIFEGTCLFGVHFRGRAAPPFIDSL
jgi:hypothetical protein